MWYVKCVLKLVCGMSACGMSCVCIYDTCVMHTYVACISVLPIQSVCEVPVA